MNLDPQDGFVRQEDLHWFIPVVLGVERDPALGDGRHGAHVVLAPVSSAYGVGGEVAQAPADA